MFSSDDLVKLLEDGWKREACLAHNWKRNPFGATAVVIWKWCDDRRIDWGTPRGYPVQEAQRAERRVTRPRIEAFQQPAGHRKIMFSLSRASNPKAFQAASRLATAHGFVLLDDDD